MNFCTVLTDLESDYFGYQRCGTTPEYCEGGSSNAPTPFVGGFNPPTASIDAGRCGNGNEGRYRSSVCCCFDYVGFTLYTQCSKRQCHFLVFVECFETEMKVRACVLTRPIAVHSGDTAGLVSLTACRIALICKIENIGAIFFVIHLTSFNINFDQTLMTHCRRKLLLHSR